jgi:hypothetical protein
MCYSEWFMEHVNTQINQVVVMYRSLIKSSDRQHRLTFLYARTSCHAFLFCFWVWRGTMPKGHLVVGARHSRVCEGEDLHIISRDSESWEKGGRYCCEGTEKGQTCVGMRTDSRSVVNWGVSGPQVVGVQGNQVLRRGQHPRRLYYPWKTTMTSGQDVSEYLDTLGLVKSYFSSYLRKKI